jgi:diguanylate cyclase (GGDEF)-like protein
VNDRRGHAAGDRVLRHVAAVAARTVRGIDTLARYGGEEFVVVAPDTGRSQARQLAERLREALDTSAPPVDDLPLRVTASIGVATIRDDDTGPDQLLGRADAALYAAKAAGRNRVAVDGPARVTSQAR